MREGKWSGIEGLLPHFHKVPKNTLFLFRGQNCDKPLLPKIARGKSSENSADAEDRMLNEFKRRGGLLLDRNADKWELLTLAQHFGMSTRLLDWTSNPLVALWFACQDLDQKTNCHLYSYIAGEDLLLNHKRDQDPFSIKGTKVVRPAVNNPRLLAQSGYFTAHTFSNTAGNWVPLEKNAKHTDRVIHFEIPGTLKQQTIKQLDALGINQMSLFPDLEGCCRYINWLHDA